MSEELLQNIEWEDLQELLTRSSRTAIVHFLEVKQIDDLCAIGFSFEFGSEYPNFQLCANTRQFFDESQSMYRRDWPQADLLEVRWNSGDYQYPSGLLDSHELGVEWNKKLVELNLIAQQILTLSEDLKAIIYQEFMQGVYDISMAAMAAIAKEGTLGDHKRLDFNIADIDSNQSQTMMIDQHIHTYLNGEFDS
ncbi:hypothetical protein [Lacunimicrobium album]